ncbi:MAG: ScyD/ScyE family protein [Chthoniobacterales bacterium]
MKRTRITSLALKCLGVSCLLALVASSTFAGQKVAKTATAVSPNVVSVFATGLNNPRGLKFGPDGFLYVAEGGTGGLNGTDGICDQVPDVGPYTANVTGSRVSKVDPVSGFRTTVIDNLPSSQTNPESGSLISGVADVAFVGDTLYALITGAGCSHGVPDFPNSIIRVNPGGSYDLVADLSTFYMNNPVKNPNPADFEPDGTPYSMIQYNGDLYAVEPNHGELDKITTTGAITRVADISAFERHIVPTCITVKNGNFYIGNLGIFPIVDGTQKILKITPTGQGGVAATGFTTVLGVAYDSGGRLYVLENTTGNPFPTPFTGDIIRLNKNGTRDVIATGLFLPTAMTFGPDGKLYVSNVGFGPPPNGLGQILKIDVR